MMRRIAFDGLLVFALVSFPWYIFVPLVLLSCIFITDFYEGLILAVSFDLLYGASSVTTIPYVALLAMGAFALSPFFRANLRWYA